MHWPASQVKHCALFEPVPCFFSNTRTCMCCPSLRVGYLCLLYYSQSTSGQLWKVPLCFIAVQYFMTMHGTWISVQQVHRSTTHLVQVCIQYNNAVRVQYNHSVNKRHCSPRVRWLDVRTCPRFLILPRSDLLWEECSIFLHQLPYIQLTGYANYDLTFLFHQVPITVGWAEAV